MSEVKCGQVGQLDDFWRVSSQKIGAFSEPDRFWKPVGFFPELLSMYTGGRLKSWLPER